MKSFCCLAVAATVLAGLSTGCTDEPEEASGFSSLPNSGASEMTMYPTDGSSGSTGNGSAPTGSQSQSGDDSTSEPGGTSTSGGPTSDTTTQGPTGPMDTGTTDPTTMPPGGCNNGMLDQNEQCDGQNLNGFTCESLGNTGGTLLCDAVTCTFDTSLCTNDTGGTSG
jgi:hypothetical protein